jgi:hypothetical protein
VYACNFHFIYYVDIDKEPRAQISDDPCVGGSNPSSIGAGTCMLRLVSRILPRIKSAKHCDVTVEILCISDLISVFISYISSNTVPVKSGSAKKPDFRQPFFFKDAHKLFP